MGSKVRARVYVSGLVQGVYFRSNTASIAKKLGVKGWVRNLPDGRVEALFEGEIRDVTRIVEWCKAGPPGAVVEDLKVSWEEYKGEFDDFLVRY